MSSGCAPISIPTKVWSRRLDAQAPDPSVHTFSRPPIVEALSLLPVAFRVGSYIYNELSEDREPIFDLRGITLEPPNPGPFGGVPCGGIGSGAIGRGFRGDFRRWSIHPGRYVHNPVTADVFALRVKYLCSGAVLSCVLSTTTTTDTTSSTTTWGNATPLSPESTLRDWDWSLSTRRPNCATYHALFPRAWTVFDEPLPGVRVVIQQVSPVLPQSYSEASLPTALFDVQVENLSFSEDIEVSVMFVFQNGYNAQDIDASSPCHHRAFRVNGTTDTIDTNGTGVRNDNNGGAPVEAAASGHRAIQGVEMTHCRTRKGLSQQPSTSPSGGVATHILDHGSCAIAALTERAATHITLCEKFVTFVSTSYRASHDAVHGSHSDWDVCSLFRSKVTDNRHQWGSSSSYGPTLNEVAADETNVSLMGTSSHMHRDEQVDAQPFPDKPETVDFESSAGALWKAFHDTGNIAAVDRFLPTASTTDSNTGGGSGEEASSISFGSAVCQRECIRHMSDISGSNQPQQQEKSCRVFSFSLAWDEPVARFGSGQSLPKHYTRFFSRRGDSASLIAAFALHERLDWEARIVRWQETTIDRFHTTLSTSRIDSQRVSDNEQDSYDHQLFNELYFLVDGGSLWLDSSNAVGRDLSTAAVDMMLLNSDESNIKSANDQVMITGTNELYFASMKLFFNNYLNRF
jgi:hypothetical protein